MDIRILKTFLLVARLLNVTQAAEQLNFTQPAVTMQVHTLEKTFGVKLFERVGKKMFLTDAGQHLLEYAQRIVDLYEETYAEMLQFKQKEELTLGVSTQMINCFLPPLLRQLQNKVPEVAISVEICMNTQEVIKGLLDNRFDIGFIHGQNTIQQLVQYAIWTEEIIWVGNCDLMKMHGDDQYITEYPIVNFTTGSVFRAKFDAVMKDQCFHSTIEYSDSIAVKRAVLNGLGISFLPRVLVQQELQEGLLIQLHKAPKLEMCISLVHHKYKDFTVPMQELLLLAQRIK